MTTYATDSAPLDLAAIRERVDAVLEEFLERKASVCSRLQLPGEVADVLHRFLFAGGKRLRPLLCVLGWHAADNEFGLPEPVVRVAASLEMFHTSILVHDDIIDGSDTRRDQPTVHRALAAAHRERLDPDRFGIHAAIILGDLAAVWSAELLHSAGLTSHQLASAIGILDCMRTDVMYGQYLDMLTTGLPTCDLELAMKIIRYKTVAYTCERPLHLGASLADAQPHILTALSAYAHPLGEAFQLQDDLLGVYGNPAMTGKSNLEDLRDGKHTALVAIGLKNADPKQQEQLRILIGNSRLNESCAAVCRDILTVTARPKIDAMIRTRWSEAQHALNKAPFPPTVIQALRYVADAVVARNK
ncbi:polyprenyl synthetase family protein [Nocardia terpenica]|uniref:Geranylgeranyl diphosphate synthase n=1 Tax=Nocardia terpenica TaxID=455432 RepID=A0A291RPJ9_9NOCA|nr:polyprenyl synthetase family protein [Nocardia terpenica]ATL69220.1 geranylgeranyl diphosphate synthase [Nocardia terpenica]